MAAELKNKTPVLICGLLAADIVFDVDAIPASAVKYRAESVSYMTGGGGCYAALAINRLGGSSAIVAKVGNDQFGKMILDSLSSASIDHANVIVDPYAHTPMSSIAIDKAGERQIVNYRDQSPFAFNKRLSFLCSPHAVLVDARWIEGSVSALEYSKSHNIPGVVDAEAPVSEDVMALATHIAFSRQGLNQFAGTNSVEEGLRKAASRFAAWVCVTDGANGTHILNHNRVESIPAPAVKAVDTLGAGDVWHGAYTLQLAQGADEISAVKFANVAAAIKCTRTGGGWSAPELTDVVEFIGSDHV